MVCEVVVNVKNEEKKISKKFLVYENFSANQNDPILNDCIIETTKEFGDQFDSVKVKINVEVT